ncbi:rRNA maturation RNase YbeY [Paenibacillus sp. IB182496]|uniref:Endoribonuclease YbeY n=1 Tax=Paenibacillus sabuli TaxID=2772509 RepID=A0A927BS58_9BACL|nr:rRNA maturation RNase YbeY [Paenibacillus sabuli]MBD2844448.1 rRNA maturation RNase YbeY [Paenibacillus sabuli]
MSIKLEWSNEQTIEPIDEAIIGRLRELLQLAAAAEQVNEGEVALTLVDDESIHQLNRDYRGIDRPTDVLSFAMQEHGADELEIVYEADELAEGLPLPDMLGDIIISVERTRAQSEEYGHSFERELGFLFVHGFLHLLGYDHQDTQSEAIMTAKQEQVLQQAGLHR